VIIAQADEDVLTAVQEIIDLIAEE